MIRWGLAGTTTGIVLGLWDQDRLRLAVEDAPGHDDPLAERLARVPAREVGVAWRKRVLAEDGRLEVVDLLGERQERLSTPLREERAQLLADRVEPHEEEHPESGEADPASRSRFRAWMP